MERASGVKFLVSTWGSYIADEQMLEEESAYIIGANVSKISSQIFMNRREDWVWHWLRDGVEGEMRVGLVWEDGVEVR